MYTHIYIHIYKPALIASLAKQMTAFKCREWKFPPGLVRAAGARGGAAAASAVRQRHLPAALGAARRWMAAAAPSTKRACGIAPARPDTAPRGVLRSQPAPAALSASPVVNKVQVRGPTAPVSGELTPRVAVGGFSCRAARLFSQGACFGSTRLLIIYLYTWS